ncbi:3-ketoacyl-ACP reductase [Kordiimonas sediminis]|uniref:3-ketoacyl-ACP reductase n=1 Tax=Kordiimonas sediminis TaxID=1735581 RepID=A0A919AWS6_9PROT|nr:SDR family oxidoreductase [Kordiimonas sediminis]GHF26828.1 3-ketoacyl-ACP reductase [Kordiimonas sediminis]
MDLGLKGRRALVTGGSRGIGFATVRKLASEGANVRFCARTQSDIDRAVDACRDLPGQVTGGACNVSDSESLAQFILETADMLDGLDIVVPNVSGGATPGQAGWQSAVQTDLMGTVTTCEVALPLIADTGGGAITVISSISGLEQTGGVSAYGTVKSALISYAAQLSETAVTQHVRVNSVSPGPIYIEDGFWGQVKRQNPEMYNAVEARHGSARLGTADEVANVVAFLSSEAASWVTGTNVKVDGGFTKGIQF